MGVGTLPSPLMPVCAIASQEADVVRLHERVIGPTENTFCRTFLQLSLLTGCPGRESNPHGSLEPKGFKFADGGAGPC